MRTHVIGIGLTTVGLMGAASHAVAMAADQGMAMGQRGSSDVKRTGIGFPDGEKSTSAGNGFDTGGAGGITRQQQPSILALTAETATSVDTDRASILGARQPHHRPVAALSGAG